MDSDDFDQKVSREKCSDQSPRNCDEKWHRLSPSPVKMLKTLIHFKASLEQCTERGLSSKWCVCAVGLWAWLGRFAGLWGRRLAMFCYPHRLCVEADCSPARLSIATPKPFYILHAVLPVFPSAVFCLTPWFGKFLSDFWFQLFVFFNFSFSLLMMVHCETWNLPWVAYIALCVQLGVEYLSALLPLPVLRLYITSVPWQFQLQEESIQLVSSQPRAANDTTLYNCVYCMLQRSQASLYCKTALLCFFVFVFQPVHICSIFWSDLKKNSLYNHFKDMFCVL